MKMTWALFVLALTQALSAETLLSEKVVSLPVDINTAQVRLSSAGYSSPLVKVLVPELADVTLLDHRNPGESAPCLATYDAVTANQVIAGRPGVENVELTIRLSKSVVPDVASSRCQVFLHETVAGKIRGFAFWHYRTLEVSPRHLQDCR